MNRKAVKKYTIGWYPCSNRAVATILTDDGRKHELPIETAAELAALPGYLREPSVFLYEDGLVAARWDELHEK